MDAPKAKTRVFQSGNSRAVRLPQGFHLELGEAEILWRGDELVLRQQPGTMTAAYDALAGMPDDVLAVGRDDRPPQARAWAAPVRRRR
ncbi:MAG TPA: hypothetical protein VNF74_15825 [Terriglobales bacterium]|nr:hypothetical protein [Terriglobales bacterium]